MTLVGAVAGWYPDPNDATCSRWWDGNQWTPHTRPTVAGAPLTGINLHSAAAKGRNHYSLITFGVGGLYLVLAFVTHFVLIGFIPLAIALRARRSAEPLAPLALAASVAVMVIGLFTLLH